MKILFYGTGSIGRRHIKNIKRIFNNKEITILCVRSGFYDHEGDSTLKDLGVQIFFDDKSAYAEKPNIVFVCNPTSLHLKTAKKAIQNGCHVFIEKPISNNTNGIKEIYDLATKSKLVVFVGYCLRFHPILKKCKQILDNGEIGRVYYSDVYFGTYLPTMHPWRDYQNTFRIKNQFGGGAALELSHEIDYLLWLFGDVKEVSAYIESISSLKIDADDILDMRIQFKSGIMAHLHLNLLSMKTRRECHLVGENGYIYFDLVKNQLEFNQINSEETKIVDYSDWKPDEMFIEEVKEFFGSIEEKTEALISIIDGKNVLDIIESAHLSHNEKKIVSVNT